LRRWAMKEHGVSPLQSVPEPEEATDRTTVRPPFDPEQFARETDSMIDDEEDPPSGRPTAPPPPGLPQYASGVMPHVAPSLASGTMPALGTLDSEAVPSLAVAREDLEWFELPTLARELLRHVDGRTPLSTLCASAGLAFDAAMAACHELDRQGLVILRRRSSTSA
jgi:hypothetical protein